jgi:hypothetical protein
MTSLFIIVFNMETLKERFRKNGLDYRLLDRNDSYALYELTYKDQVGSAIVGYEVDRIRIQKAHTMFGRTYPDAEVIPGNEEFGMDGSELVRSKSFFPQELDRAEEYLNLRIRS